MLVIESRKTNILIGSITLGIVLGVACTAPRPLCVSDHSVRAKTVEVVAPDTIKVVFAEDKRKQIYTLRYRGVLGPGSPNHYFYQSSLEENRRLVENPVLELSGCVQEAGSTMIWADVYIDQTHVNARLVSRGFAWGRDSLTGQPSALAKLESQAKSEKQGLWKVWWANNPSVGPFPLDDPDEAFRNALRDAGYQLNPARQYEERMVQRWAPAAWSQFLGSMVTGELPNYPEKIGRTQAWADASLNDEFGDFLKLYIGGITGRTSGGTVKPWTSGQAQAAAKQTAEFVTNTLGTVKELGGYEACSNWLKMAPARAYEAISAADYQGRLTQLQLVIASLLVRC